MDNTHIEKDCVVEKIFVGNVPFQCMENEFKDCLKNIDGFIDAEIVTRHNSPFSRGFGFVTVRTKEDAKKLVQRNDIIFKDRILRFTEYNFQDKIKIPKQQSKNYIFVKNVPKEMNRDQLKNIFSTKGAIGACFINTNVKTGESKGNAVVEIKEDDVYDDLVSNKILNVDGYVFELSKWKNKNKQQYNLGRENKQNKYDSQEIYRLAFNAGVNVGRLEGLRIAKKKNYFDSNSNLHQRDF